jgi:hypothetical protein
VSKSPYPRDNPVLSRERRFEYARAWFLYVAGTGFICLGLWWLLYNAPGAVLTSEDVLIRSGIVAFGLIGRGTGQMRLSRLKGLTKAHRMRLIDFALWLPWYLRQPHSDEPTTAVIPPP